MLFKFQQIATWAVVSLLILVFFFCFQAFNWRTAKLGYENQILDSRFWYTPAEAQSFLMSLGSEGRNLYALTQITLDVIFPITYGALFAALIVHLYSALLAQRLLILPLGAAMADLGENFTTAYLAWSFTGSQSSLVWLALVFTLIKFALFITSLVLILIGGVRGVVGLSP